MPPSGSSPHTSRNDILVEQGSTANDRNSRARTDTEEKPPRRDAAQSQPRAEAGEDRPALEVTMPDGAPGHARTLPKSSHMHQRTSRARAPK
eukprot:918718-Alexandrium_andersonii.AAC.1